MAFDRNFKTSYVDIKLSTTQQDFLKPFIFQNIIC